MVTRWLWFALGCSSLGLGIAGAVLPLLPTTPFLLLAAWAFARSSPRLHAWLIGHPRLGPAIVQWQEHGVIPRPAKGAAMAAIAATVGASLAMGVRGSILAAQGAVLTGVAVFLLSRPSTPEEAARRR